MNQYQAEESGQGAGWKAQGRQTRRHHARCERTLYAANGNCLGFTASVPDRSATGLAVILTGDGPAVPVLSASWHEVAVR